MSDIIGKVINKQYLLTQKIYEDELVKNYNAEDEDGNQYLVVRLKDSSPENQQLIDRFYSLADFINKFNIREIPSFVSIIKSPSENILILKKRVGTPIAEYLKNDNQQSSYKNSFEKIKRLLISVDIATRNGVFFDISKNKDVLIYEDTVVINSPITLKNDIDKTNKQLLNLYNFILTNHSFYEENKLPTQYGVNIPQELEKYIYVVLTDKKKFHTVESFYNSFYDAIVFSPMHVIKKEDMIKEDEVGFGVFLSQLLLFFAIVVVLAIVIFKLSKKVINSINGFDNKIINSFDNIYDSSFGVPTVKDQYLRGTYLKSSGGEKNYDKIFKYLITAYYMDEIGTNDWIDVLFNYDIITSENGITLMSYSENDNYIKTFILVNEKTGEETVLLEDVNIKTPIIVKDKVYFSYDEESNYLYKIDFDGENLTQVLNKPVGYLQKNKAEDKLYYVTVESFNNLPIINELDLATGESNQFENSYLNKNYNVFLYIEAYNLLRIEKMDFYNQLVEEFDYDFFNTNIGYYEGKYFYTDYYETSLFMIKNNVKEFLSSSVYECMIFEEKLYYIDFEYVDFNYPDSEYVDYGSLMAYNIDNDEKEFIYKDAYTLHCILKDKLYIETMDDSGDNSLISISKNEETDEYEFTKEYWYYHNDYYQDSYDLLNYAS